MLVHRKLRGMRVAVRVPLQSFLGVVIGAEHQQEAFQLTLAHADPALSVDLGVARDEADAIAEWQAWGRALSVPLLVETSDGVLKPAARCGLGVEPAPRRRRRNAIKARRPSILLRRRPGVLAVTPALHQEREIIART